MTERTEDAEKSATDAEQAAEDAQAAATRSEEQADRAEAAVELAAPIDDPVIDPEVREAEAGVDSENPFGRPGRPLSRRSPFVIGFTAALGVAVAYVLALAVADARQVLILILIAAFVAVGLEPAVEWLERHRVRRGFAVLIVVLAALAFLGGFLAAIAPPIAHQSSQLVKEAPTYLQKLDHNPTIHRLDNRYHLVAKLQQRARTGISINALGGVFGVGKAVLSAVASLVTVVILTIYFLANLPGIKRMAYRAAPRSRRARVGLLSDEMLARVGGYVLGNLATSVVAGLAAFLWLLAWGVPYPVALGLLIAIFDLIPLVGATAGAVIVTLVAFFHGVVPGVATGVFFLVYQQFENYILQPRIMRRTVDVAPLVTILSALVGAALLGILGALIAVPIAAGIQLLLVEVVYPHQDES